MSGVSISRPNKDSCVITIPPFTIPTPVDAVTYYWGALNTVIANSDDFNRFYIGRPGTITACYLTQLISPTLGSNETSSVYIRLNNTTDYTVLNNTFTNDATSSFFSNTAMSVPIVAGDYIEIKWIAPTWATDPTAILLGTQLLLEG